MIARAKSSNSHAPFFFTEVSMRNLLETIYKKAKAAHAYQPMEDLYFMCREAMKTDVGLGVEYLKLLSAECERAIDLIRSYGYKGEFFLYCILMELKESYQRINYWKKNKKVLPHAQPYRSLTDRKQIVPQWQIDMARWTDRKEIYRTCDFYDFEPRRGFKCIEYFK